MNWETGLVCSVFFPFLAGAVVFGAGALGSKKKTKQEREIVSEGSQEGLRDGISIAAVVIEFFVMLALAAARQNIYVEIPEICGFGLTFTLDGFRAVYGCVATFMWMMTTILSKEYFNYHSNLRRFYLFLLWTLGAALGVFLSADLYTTFIFFEIMSFTSYVWVAQEENQPALRAAATYLAVAVIGGLVMLMGIFLFYHQLGTVAIGELADAAAGCSDKGILYMAGLCMLLGFGAKAGAFPLHIWLPKAHPVAPAPASALLSGILTKTGVYGILILSCNLFLHDRDWGWWILLLGAATMFGGALLAVFSVDLKRTLACSSMSQIGFILVGVGMQGILGEDNTPAVHGTFLHMVNHSLIKLVLFMAAGVVYMNAHALDLNAIRGFGRKKPLLMGIFLTGTLAIGGVPLFGGYISKTLLHESIVEYGGGGVMRAVEYLFLFSGGLTVAYMIKLFVAVFVEKNEDDRLQERYDGMTRYMNPATAFALTGSAAVLLLWGLFPHMIMDRAARFAQGFMKLEDAGGRQAAYFSFECLKGALISLCIGAVVYWIFVRRLLIRKKSKTGTEYVDAWPKWLDLEELIYRPILLKILPTICGVLCRVLDSLVDAMVVVLRKTLYRDSPLPHERPEGNVFTAALGRVLNAVQSLGNHTWRKKNPAHRNYVHLAAVKNEEIKENNLIIQRSLSFGLLLFCIGLSLTLLYIIWW